MGPHEEKLKQFIRENKIQADHLHFEQSCHSVEEAAEAAQAKPEEFVKNICTIDKGGNLIVSIVKGEDRVSRTLIGEALNIDMPRMATPEEILERTGYLCGGTPSFGYEATFLIDPRVMEVDTVYTGGGSEQSLVKISTKELQKTNQGRLVKIRK